LIVVTQHYDTLQAIGADTNSNLILLPNSPQAGSDMLNNMVASFSASNQIGESMKEGNRIRLANKKAKKSSDDFKPSDDYQNLKDTKLPDDGDNYDSRI
jgi:hypothetical protein